MKKITLLKLLSINGILILFSLSSSAQNMALDFDGTAGLGGSEISGQLVRTESMIPFDDTFSIVTYIKVKSINSNIFVWGCTSLNNYIAFDVDADYKLRVRVPDVIGNSITSLSSLDTGWHQITVTSDKGNVSVYIDGNLEVDNAFIDLSQLSPSISSFGTGSFNGLWEGAGNFVIQNFGIFDEAIPLSVINNILSQAELEAYLNVQVSNSETGHVLAAYTFSTLQASPGSNNSEARRLEDKTGNYHGELIGFPLTGSTGNWVEAQSTLSLTDIGEQSDNIKLFPNPAKNYINILNVSKETTYKVYNVLGTQVLSNRLMPEQKIDVTSLSFGMYFIKFGDNQTLKFLKT